MFKRNNCVAGIDIGLSGGFAVYDPNDGKIVTTVALPIQKIQKGRYTDKNIDIQNYALLVSDAVVEYGIEHVFIEQVHSSPQMGIASAFKFGDGFGIVRAITELYVPNVAYVPPPTWKSKLMLSSDKKKSIELARKLFGKSPWFVHESKDGLAEAALIAYYGATHVLKRQPSATEEDPLS